MAGAKSAGLLHVALQHGLANRPHLSHKVWDKDRLDQILTLVEAVVHSPA